MPPGFSAPPHLPAGRQVEPRTYDSVPARLLTADTHPDHDTLCIFRRENQALLNESFVQVLELALVVFSPSNARFTNRMWCYFAPNTRPSPHAATYRLNR